MKILITGGTGTIGQALAAKLYETHEVTIFSRNEATQVSMKLAYPKCKYIIGDVRDYSSIDQAVKGQDLVYHLASLKHIDICEKQPDEAVKTNVLGALNVATACRYNEVAMVYMSTDKAANPMNVYGRTKRLAEDLVKDVSCIVRSGNVIGSSGSFIPKMIYTIQTENCVYVTDMRMTRFFVSLDVLIDTLINCRLSFIGRTVIPNRMKSFNIQSLVEAIIKQYGDGTTEIKIIGAREGEQLLEYLNGVNETLLKVTDDICEITRGKGIFISSDDCIGTREDLYETFKLYLGEMPL